MSLPFRGSALPLSEQGLFQVTNDLGVKTAELWAVLTVETLGCGFLADRRPVILFERHIFSDKTHQQYDATHPDISNKESGGYGIKGPYQYDRLEKALLLNRTAALKSASWGIGQLMGFNAGIAGYTKVEDMVDKMSLSEDYQLSGIAKYIINTDLNKALQRHDWATFARGYNGPKYAENSYDTRLAAAYQKYYYGPLPDLHIRVAQIYLIYLGYDPGPVDGLLGRITRSALNEFQVNHQLPVSNIVDDSVLSDLKAEVDKLPV